jgi:hypothetical protein
MRQERVSENRRFLVRDQASRQISASTPRGKVFEPTGASGPGLATKPSSDMEILRRSFDIQRSFTQVQVSALVLPGGL